MSTSRTKTARTAKTEAAILDGLSSLVTQVPVSKISLTELAKHSGLTRSTVYNQVTSVPNALGLLGERLWQEAQALANQQTAVSKTIESLVDWVSTDKRIQGFRKHNPALFQELLAKLCRLDDDVYARRVTEILMSWSVAADLDTATTLMRWISSWAIEPGNQRERESASELFARLLLADVRS